MTSLLCPCSLLPSLFSAIISLLAPSLSLSLSLFTSSLFLPLVASHSLTLSHWWPRTAVNSICANSCCVDSSCVDSCCVGSSCDDSCCVYSCCIDALSRSLSLWRPRFHGPRSPSKRSFYPHPKLTVALIDEALIVRYAHNPIIEFVFCSDESIDGLVTRRLQYPQAVSSPHGTVIALRLGVLFSIAATESTPGNGNSISTMHSILHIERSYACDFSWPLA